MQIEDLKLDGNAIGGLLQELFGTELTGRGSVCASCGMHGEMARLDVYYGAGIVGRCCHCQAVMIRIVQGRDRTWLDLSGIASLELG
jgi:Family of unknown function (DUF6510)